MFWEYSRVDGFACLSALGGFCDDSKEFLAGVVVSLIVAHQIPLHAAVQKCYPRITKTNIEVFANRDTTPNVISIFHLIAQSLVNEHVCSPWYPCS